MSGQQPNHEPAIQYALQWLEANSIESYASDKPDENQRFIPYTAIKTYFDYSRLQTIAEAVWTGLPRGECQRIAGDIIKQESLRVFCILLCIGSAQHIRNFLRHDLLDARFPTTQAPDEFPKDVDWSAFHRVQWRYYACRLVQGMERTVSKDKILPIVARNGIGRGDDNTVFRITVHYEYDGMHDLKDNIGSVSRNYALKVYEGPEAQEHYESEVKALTRIQAVGYPVDSLLYYYGAYVYSGAYHVIMEFADAGTLEEYFQKVTPPTDGADILSIWQATFGLAEAVHRVHLANGWHQDINPKNILIKSTSGVSQYAYSHKLADWGQSHFKDLSTSVEVAQDLDTYGTKEYGAPECHRLAVYDQNTRVQLLKSVDIWSLACVWSEVAVWIVLGYAGLLRYRKLRQIATAELGLDAGAGFHNGVEILPCVREMHITLRDSGRMSRQDYLTHQTWETLVQNMMRYDGPGRLLSREVLHESARILDVARTRLTAAIKSRQSRAGVNKGDRAVLSTRGSDPSSGGLWSEENPGDEPYLTEIPIPRTFTRASFEDHSSSMERAYPATLRDEQSVTRRQTDYPSHVGPGIRGLYASHAAFRSSTADNLPRGSTSYTAGGDATSRPYDRKGPSHNKQMVRLRSGMVPLHNRDVAPTQRRDPRKRVPRLSFAEGSNWVSRLATDHNARLPDGDRLQYKLGDRDHLFLIDDSSTMRNFHSEVCAIFQILARIIEDEDPDDIQLRYLMSTTSITDPSSAALHDNLVRHRFGGRSNVELRLESILDDYREKLVARSPSTRPLSIYVMTDGLWQSSNPEVPIMAIVQTLVNLKLPREQVGIQFIGFGENTSGLEHLKLIDQMNLDWGLDIVDTESSQGNIWKMLLGAIDEAFDDYEDEVEDVSTEPHQDLSSTSELPHDTAADSSCGEPARAVAQSHDAITTASILSHHTVSVSLMSSAYPATYTFPRTVTHESTDPTSHSREQSSRLPKMQERTKAKSDATFEKPVDQKTQDEFTVFSTGGDHETIVTREDREEDRMTICTGSVGAPEPHTLASKHRLASGFVKMFKDDPTLSNLNAEAGKAVTDTCPRLLRAYALMLRNEVKLDLEKAAYLFVRQQRKLIMRCLESMLVNVDDEADGPRLANLGSQLPPQEMVQAWLGEIEVEMDTPQKTLLGLTGQFTLGDRPLHGNDDTWSDTSIRAQADEEDGFLDYLVPRLNEVTQFLTDNTAWLWLKSRLQASSRSTHWPHEILELVMDTIGEPEYHDHAMTEVSGRYSFDIAVCWNPRKYLDTYYEASNDYTLEDTVVLTGRGEILQASICSTYLKTMWPWAGLELVRALQLALHGGLGLTTCDTIYHVIGDCEVTFRQVDDVLHAHVRAPIPAVVEIVEQLAFLGSACSAAEELSQPCNRKAKLQARSTVSTKGVYQLGLAYEEEVVKVDAQCWKALFRNPSIACDFPARPRDPKFTGMEMSGDIMIKLGELIWATVSANRFMLKGFSTLFYPVIHESLATVWHFVCAAEQGYLSYTAARESCLGRSALDRRELLGMRSSRNFVGWAPETTSHFGKSFRPHLRTKDYDFATLGHPTNLSKGSNLVLEKLTLSASKYLGVNLTIAQGTHHRGHFYSGGSTYVRLMLHARKMFTIFYDTGLKQAYLSDGASAVLHVTCAQLTSPDMARYSEKDVRDRFKYAVPGSPDAALDALLDTENRRLVIDKDEKEVTQEVVQTADGLRSEQDPKAKIEYWRVRDLVVENYEHVLQLWERQAEVSEGLDLRFTNRVRLEGWSLKSIIDGPPALDPKLVYLTTSGRGWVSLAKQLNAVTLMGTGLGPLIQVRQHSCRKWSAMPKGQDYLACQLSLLKEIATSHGDLHGVPLRMTFKTRWRQGLSLFEPCNGTAKAGRNCCDRIQLLSSKKGLNCTSALGGIMDVANLRGAVLFGHGTCPTLCEDSCELPQTDEGYASLSPSNSRIASSSDRVLSRQASREVSQNEEEPGSAAETDALYQRSDRSPSSEFKPAARIVSRNVGPVFAANSSSTSALHDSTYSSSPLPERQVDSRSDIMKRWNYGMGQLLPPNLTQRDYYEAQVRERSTDVVAHWPPAPQILRRASKSRILQNDDTSIVVRPRTYAAVAAGRPKDAEGDVTHDQGLPGQSGINLNARTQGTYGQSYRSH
ncbi:hypothetical protein LTR22_013085 [Elasticomyces elasticus]|nr:hypothetical protein LTR22_013085 [Elasticomyces elasticus]